ncbi:MAG: hypothetical protein AAF577_03430 [Pseudomonadota bacterium]
MGEIVMGFVRVAVSLLDLLAAAEFIGSRDTKRKKAKASRRKGRPQ